LLQLLVDTRNCLSSDPRDKIFSLLPLFAQRESDCLSADDNASVVGVYTRAAIEMIRDCGADILSSAIYSKSEGVPLLPSWVPDWSLPQARTRLTLRQIFAHHHFFSKWNTQFRPKVALQYKAGAFLGFWYSIVHGTVDGHLETLNHLVLRSVRLDNIRAVSRSCNVYQSKSWANLVFKEWPQRMEANTNQVNWGAHFIYACFQAMMLQSETEKEAWFPHREFLHSWFRLGIRQPLSNEQNIACRTFYDRVELACHGRSLMISDNGYVGLAPYGAESGDIIQGASTPFVIRRWGQIFIMIGECHVRVIMNGEYLENDELRGGTELVWKDITIV
jgi:hypothetical protein